MSVEAAVAVVIAAVVGFAVLFLKVIWRR